MGCFQTYIVSVDTKTEKVVKLNDDRALVHSEVAALPDYHCKHFPYILIFNCSVCTTYLYNTKTKEFRALALEIAEDFKLGSGQRLVALADCADNKFKFVLTGTQTAKLYEFE